MQTIGEQIRAARKAKRMTQDQLAEILNMSRQGISHWEQGRTSPDAEMLLRLSQVLEYSFEAHHEAVLPVRQSSPDIEPKKAPGTPKDTLSSSAWPAAAEPLSHQPEEPADDTAPAADHALAGDEELPPDVPSFSATKETAGHPVPAKRQKGRIILASIAALFLIGLGLLVCLPRTASPRVSIGFVEKKIDLMYYPAYFDGYGYGWLFTLAIHNESSVPLHPDKIVTLFYSNGRINSKLIQTYDDYREFMDSDLLHSEDTPLHLYMATNQLASDRVECILYATDPDGIQHTYTTAAPLHRPDN